VKSTVMTEKLAGAVADLPIPSAFGAMKEEAITEDAFEAMLKALPEGTGDLDALLESEMGAAGRSSSLDIFRRLHSLRALSLRTKGQHAAGIEAIAEAKKNGSASNDSGVTGIDNLPKNVPVLASAMTTCRPTREKRARGKAISRDSSYADVMNTDDLVSDKALKKERRMLSNRESARRSRRRKQELMLDLENQVARLTEENEALKKRIAVLEGRV
jgi:hypothetical protein